MNTSRIIALFSLLGLASVHAADTGVVLKSSSAQSTITSADKTAPAGTKTADPDAVAKNGYDKLGFSAGFAAIYMFKDEAIEDASVDANNIVRANALSRARTTPVLQAYFPILNSVLQENLTTQLGNRYIAPGQSLFTESVPVMGIQTLLELGGEDVIRSFGVGLLWSWRKYEVDSNAKIKVVAPAFNLGVAALIEPNVKTLGKGLTVNQPLPANDAIRYDKKPGFGVALTFSAGF